MRKEFFFQEDRIANTGKASADSASPAKYGRGVETGLREADRGLEAAFNSKRAGPARGATEPGLGPGESRPIFAVTAR